MTSDNELWDMGFNRSISQWMQFQQEAPGFEKFSALNFYYLPVYLTSVQLQIWKTWQYITYKERRSNCSNLIAGESELLKFSKF